jgi:protein-S-isoprenylcysteine O-methyltransferase Ste14
MTSRKTSTAFAIWIRALFYLLVVAGGWLVVLPMLILFLEQGHFVLRLREMPWPFIGAISFITGTLLGLVSGYYLVTRGRGTPLPLDPTQELVTCGPYKYVRNPQAIAMVLTVTGEIVVIQSWALWLLLPLTLIYLEVLVGSWEERDLVAKHGERYQAYKRNVHKWIPFGLVSQIFRVQKK